MRSGCSSQEEHVLKLDSFYKAFCLYCCSSQEEHVLKLGAMKFLKPRSCCSSQEEHVLKLYCQQTDMFPYRCSSQEEHVLKHSSPYYFYLLHSCSSQEEHVLKQFRSSNSLLWNAVAPRKRSMYWNFKQLIKCLIKTCCSSQEEHVLKQRRSQIQTAKFLLLLARGACIETMICHRHYLKCRVAPRKRSMYWNCFVIVVMKSEQCCSSQEEHVLKLGWSVSPCFHFCCSSQEEHVLKHHVPHFFCVIARVAPRKRSMYWNDAFPCLVALCQGCSSQEEHVLKRKIRNLRFGLGQLLLARGACIETRGVFVFDGKGLVAPRKRSMYWNFETPSTPTEVSVAPRKRSMYWN